MLIVEMPDCQMPDQSGSDVTVCFVPPLAFFSRTL